MHLSRDLKMDRGDLVFTIIVAAAVSLWSLLGWGIFSALTNATTLGAVVGFTIIFIIWIIVSVIGVILLLIVIFS